MTTPDATAAARHALLEYHERTKHSPVSVRASGHVLDWANQPLPFKIYEDLEAIPLPRDWPPSAMPALEAIGVGAGTANVAAAAANPAVDAIPDIVTLAR